MLSNKSIYNKILVVAAISLVASCKKFVDIPPPETKLVTESVFASDATATAAILGIYINMMQDGLASGNSKSVTNLCGLSADELMNFSSSADRIQFYENSLSSSNSLVKGLWGNAFNYIWAVNGAIEGLTASKAISFATKNQLMGEAKFIRAFCNFYLVNLYGDVPLATTSNYQVNSSAARVSKEKIYEQIVADLVDAQQLLSDDYVTGERIRPNKSTAIALLARVYLYTGNWTGAETSAAMVINNSALYGLETNLDSVFLANSRESIWQLMPVTISNGRNTWEGSEFILLGSPASTSLTSTIVNAFEVGDSRRTHWVDSIIVGSDTFYYAYKYKVKTSTVGSPLTEYSMVFRLAEQYLLRAESRAMQNNLPGALADLNIIRERAGLADFTSEEQSEILLAIEHERQVELFTEWGHRWFDLKRTGRADIVLGIEKAPNWQTNDQLYPIPQTEIQNDPNLTQNPGY